MPNRFFISDVNPTDDLGALIKQADDQLGNAYGEIIVICGGGNFRTSVNLSPKRYLYFGPGEYFHHIPIPSNPALPSPMIFYDSDNTIEGAGWSTIFHENMDYRDPHACHIITPKPGLNPTDNLIIRHFKVQGHPENGGAGDGSSSIGASNVHNVQISGIYLQGTGAIGISTGNSSDFGDHGQNVFVTDCLFQDIFQPAALTAVNARGFVFSRNIFRRCGNPIDLEANSNADYESVWIVSDNVIDSREMAVQGEVAITVHGPIGVVDGENDDGYGTIANNMIVGGDRRGGPSKSYNNYIVGISVWGNAHEVLIAHNNLFAIGQSAIDLRFSTRVRVEGNKITNGADAIILEDCVNCQIVNNDIQQIDGSAQGNNRIQEKGASNRNLIYNNFCGPAAQQGALAPGIVLTGVDSIGDHTDNKIAAFVESVSVSRGTVGDPVVITGTTFYQVTAVLFNDTKAAFTVDSLTQITTSIPGGATSGPIKIRTYAGLCIGPDFTVR